VNETFLKVNCNQGIAPELNEFFSFFAPGYKFMPAFKRRQWDGRIRLFNNRNNGLYVGLLPYLKSFCDERDYDLEFDSHLELQEEFSFQEAVEYSNEINLPFEPRKYQLEAFTHCIRNNRSMILSPTGSGKTLRTMATRKSVS
jgi:hypothetical protein